jgi:hypothetical protein
MRMPRLRFTVRQMMVAVATLAIVLGVWLWGERRRAHFYDLAEWHRHHVLCVIVKTPGPDGKWVYETTYMPRKKGDPRVPLRQQRISAWHREIGLKYWQAARHPWLPVQPDPPGPE